MSDEDTPDNVHHLPRIGSPPPPPVPLPPDLDGEDTPPDDGSGAVRISSFDAPQVPVAPTTPAAVPAALRADGMDPRQGPDAGPPRAGALSLAVVLAIALAAFEGLQTWIQESAPRRAEAAKHAREMELLAAKAHADADRMGAEADVQRAKSQRVPSSHEYGRSTHGSRSGPLQRAGGGTGPGGLRRGGTGPHSGSTRPGGPAPGRGQGGRSGPVGPNRSPAGPPRPPGSSGSSGRPGNGRPGNGRPGGGGSGPGAHPGRGGAGPRGGTGGGSGRGPGGSGGGTSRGATGAGTKGAGGATGAGTGRANGAGTQPGSSAGASRSPRQKVADWLRGRNRTDAAGSGGAGSGAGTTSARIRDSVARQQAQPTFWDRLGSRARERWKNRHAGDGAPSNGADWKPPATNDQNPDPDSERVSFRQAVFFAFRIRWDKRRDDWKARGGPRPKTPPRKPKAAKAKAPRSPRGGSRRQQQADPPPGAASATGAPGPGPGYGAPRTSVFDTDGPEVVITSVEQVDPPGAHAKRWEPNEITRGQQQLPRQGTPALPRAPQRPAGSRPGTTRRREPIAMPPAPSPASNTGAVAPVSASLPAPGGMSAQHATELRLDTALKVLEALTTSGMETHDDCAQLARLARRLLGEIEAMAHDLARNHNVTGSKTMKAIAALLEDVGDVVIQAERMARDCLAASELAEAEEAAMARDHRPMQNAYLDAGVSAPSARIHNEN